MPGAGRVAAGAHCCWGVAVSNSGRSVAYMPPGDRKSGIPAATDIPAPVSTTTLRQLSEAINSAREASVVACSSAAVAILLRRSQGRAGGLGRQTGGQCSSVGRAPLANIAWAPQPTSTPLFPPCS